MWWKDAEDEQPKYDVGEFGLMFIDSRERRPKWFRFLRRLWRSVLAARGFSALRNTPRPSPVSVISAGLKKPSGSIKLKRGDPPPK